MADTTPSEIVQSYIDQHYRIVTWPAIGDQKGPIEKSWQEKTYSASDYRDGYRVGIVTGTEIEPGKFLVDVDIDWAPGSPIAQALLPPTSFVFGRPSKRVSHCFYTIPDALPLFRYEDIDKTCLIEFRGTKMDGTLGHQTMAPPSVWSKDGKFEPLQFIKRDHPAFIAVSNALKQRVCLSAIGMILAKHLGHNGFGHEARLMWAGYLLRANITVDELVTMGEAISGVCNNQEIQDVRRVVESTAARLASDTAQKIKGGPALAKLIGLHGKAVIARINEWLGRDSDFLRNQQGVILPKNQENIRRAIDLLDDKLTYNEFADKLLFNGRPLEDPQWMGLYLKIDREYRFQPPIDYFKMVIKDIAWQNGFHPVKQYLNTLTWDGVPRIDQWLITSAGAEDSPYVRAISSIMLIAAVRRIHQPGCKYDEMVVWESHQGSEKSSAAAALCPDPSWFSDDLRLNLQSQELIEATLGKWIIEASDLAGKKKAELEQLKAMMSRQVDGPARMAYAHFPVERPRHFIIIGTTNSSAYLTDPTGARRFWPMTVTRFNTTWIREHRDQLWAEACVREAAGESIRLNESLWPHAGEEQERRREIDPWEPLLRRAILRIEPGSGLRRRVPTSVLWESLGIPSERRDRYGSLRITEIMQRLGFKRTRVRPDGEEVQVGFVQETDVIELREEHAERVPGEDDTPF